MATYKRRVVYLSDQEWAMLAALAKRENMTISATVRRMINLSKSEPPISRFNTRPFTPVPKKR